MSKVSVTRCFAAPDFSPETTAEAVTAILRHRLVESELIQKFEIDPVERDAKERPSALLRIWYDDSIEDADRKVYNILQPLWASNVVQTQNVLTLAGVNVGATEYVSDGKGELHPDLNVEVPIVASSEPEQEPTFGETAVDELPPPNTSTWLGPENPPAEEEAVPPRPPRRRPKPE